MPKLQNRVYYYYIALTTIVFLLIPTYLFSSKFSFLFQSDGIQNDYGFISPIIIYSSFVIFLIRIKQDKDYPYENKSDYIKKIKYYIGFKPFSFNRIFKGAVFGGILFLIDSFSKIVIYQHYPIFSISNFINNINYNFIQTISSLSIIPIFEEIVYRGLLLGSYIIILNNEHMMYPLIISSFIFGFTHPNFPMLKVIGGVSLGFIYLWNDNRNIDLVIYSHIILNFIISFFYS